MRLLRVRMWLRVRMRQRVRLRMRMLRVLKRIAEQTDGHVGRSDIGDERTCGGEGGKEMDILLLCALRGG